MQTKRKAAYVRTASKQGKTLAAWMLEACDNASGYDDTTCPERKGNAEASQRRE